MKRSLLSMLTASALLEGFIAWAGTPVAADRQRDDRPPISTQPLSPEILALQTHSDLVARDAGFPNTTELAFELLNRGKIAAAGSIRIDVFIDNVPRGSMTVAPLGGNTQRHTRVPIASSYIPHCAQTRNVRIVVDAANQVAELHEDNNRLEGPTPRRCPDLAVASIHKNMNSLGTEYVAEVELVNRGDAVAPEFYYLAKTDNQAIVTPLPDLDEKLKGPLAPGATTKFTVGNAFAYQDMHVLVWLDRRGFVEESDESNNMVEKTLD